MCVDVLLRHTSIYFWRAYHYFKHFRPISTNPTKNWGWTQVLWKVFSFCSTSGTRRASLVANRMTSYEWGIDQEVLARKYHSSSYWHRCYTSDNACHDVLAYNIQSERWPVCCYVGVNNLVWSNLLLEMIFFFVHHNMIVLPSFTKRPCHITRFDNIWEEGEIQLKQ